MENAVRAVACAIACAGSIIAAALAGGHLFGLVVMFIGIAGFFVFGRLTIHELLGSDSQSKMKEILFNIQPRRRRKKKTDELE